MLAINPSWDRKPHGLFLIFYYLLCIQRYSPDGHSLKGKTLDWPLSGPFKSKLIEVENWFWSGSLIVLVPPKARALADENMLSSELLRLKISREFENTGSPGKRGELGESPPKIYRFLSLMRQFDWQTFLFWVKNPSFSNFKFVSNSFVTWIG